MGVESIHRYGTHSVIEIVVPMLVYLIVIVSLFQYSLALVIDLPALELADSSNHLFFLQ